MNEFNIFRYVYIYYNNDNYLTIYGTDNKIQNIINEIQKNKIRVLTNNSLFVIKKNELHDIFNNIKFNTFYFVNKNNEQIKSNTYIFNDVTEKNIEEIINILNILHYKLKN